MADKTTERYIEGIGRRKRAIARVRITPSAKESILINNRAVAEYFETPELEKIAVAALRDIELEQKFEITVKVLGGGIASQAESVRLGTSRALLKFNSELRGELKKLGYLKRDPRIKERKKPGLKKARKSPQWSKR